MKSFGGQSTLNQTRSTVTSRNLTKQFIIARESHKSSRSRLSREVIQLFENVEEIQETPLWVELVSEIQNHLEVIQNKISGLGKLHSQRLKIVFGKNENEQDREIDEVTVSITEQFRLCQNKLKRIAIIPSVNSKGENKTMTAEDKSIRLNVMQGLGIKLQDATRQFRSMQRQFISQLKGQVEAGNKFYGIEEEKRLLASNDGLKDVDLEQNLVIDNRQSDLRSQEIAKIAKSINGLAEMFTELSVLIVEQGSVLDRIDYNVENTLNSIKAGHGELVSAEKYQNSKLTLACVGVLLVIVVILVTILFFKWI